MKTFSLFLLTIAAITAAPMTSSASEDAENAEKLQRVILKEIIQSVKHLNHILGDEAKKILVQEAITHKNCTHQNLCETARVLETLKAENLRLPEKDWLLPRQLVAYTRSIQCKDPAPHQEVELQVLLKYIQHCAQKMFAGP